MTDLKRFPDWRKRLDAYLDGLDGKPFEWGVLDCALFGADAVHAMTGVDFAADFRGKYSDRDSGAALIAAAGHASYADLVASCLPEIALGEAVIGDIALADGMFGEAALAIVGGVHLNCMTPRGKGVLPLSKASRVFRVPLP